MNTNKKYCILIDDDDDDQLIFHSTLKRAFSAYEYIGIYDFEGLSKFLAGINLIDIGYIFLDLNIPKVNGFEILEFLKANEETKHLKVIIYTTSNNPRDVNECLKRGAEAFITKPSKINDVITQLARFLK